MLLQLSWIEMRACCSNSQCGLDSVHILRRDVEVSSIEVGGSY